MAAYSENPGHLEVGYDPRAPSAGKAKPGMPSKAQPFDRNMWIERRLYMRDEFLHHSRQHLVHKDPGASQRLNFGCQSKALLRSSAPYQFFPESPGGQYVNKMYMSSHRNGFKPNTDYKPWLGGLPKQKPWPGGNLHSLP